MNMNISVIEIKTKKTHNKFIKAVICKNVITKIGLILTQRKKEFHCNQSFSDFLVKIAAEIKKFQFTYYLCWLNSIRALLKLKR